MADSWKTDGNCAECRRVKYCSKRCSANKAAIQNMVRNVLMTRTGMGAVKAVLNEHDMTPYMAEEAK